jgi:hypothetical protein
VGNKDALRRRPLRWLAGLTEAALWTVEHYASEAADRLNQWRTS